MAIAKTEEDEDEDEDEDEGALSDADDAGDEASGGGDATSTVADKYVSRLPVPVRRAGTAHPPLAPAPQPHGTGARHAGASW